MGLRPPVPRAARLLAPVRLGVHRGPGAALRLLLARAVLHVAVGDVLGAALLLVRVLALVSPRHFGLLRSKVRIACPLINPMLVCSAGEAAAARDRCLKKSGLCRDCCLVSPGGGWRRGSV